MHIQYAKTWALAEIEYHFQRLKTNRIKVWKQRIQHSANHGCTYIFKHLQNKLQDEPANLVEDDHGNILYQPDCALHHLNNKWDEVYAANVLHDHPLQMLQVIWPYIQNHVTQADMPPLDAEALFRTVQSGKLQQLQDWMGGERVNYKHSRRTALCQLPDSFDGLNVILTWNCHERLHALNKSSSISQDRQVL